MTSVADLQYEFRLRSQGFNAVVGIDEAGRGAWAGPVVAGAVILPLNRFDLGAALTGVNDSKQLTREQRENVFSKIMKVAAAASIGYATHAEIDDLGIVPATLLAMQRALETLHFAPDCLLTDYVEVLYNKLPCVALKKGDQKSLSIAAASILAKVTRDQFMDQLDALYPQYGFWEHKGYGTALHRSALSTYGPTDVHRMSFAPIQSMLNNHPSAAKGAET